MMNYIIKMLFELLTDFGPAALAIILFTVTYFDWRMKQITKKLLETNFTVSDLEKENLKQVNDVRADSQRDSQNILLISEMQGKTLTEAFMLLVDNVNKNAATIAGLDYEGLRDGLKHFSENLEQLETAVLSDASSEGHRRVALEREVQSLKEDLESLQSTVGLHESIMEVREEGPIEVKPLVQPLPPVEDPHSVEHALAIEQRHRNQVTLFESRIDVVPDIDDLDKNGYELLLSAYIIDMKEQGIEIPSIEESFYGNRKTGMDCDIVRFYETGLTARFGEGQEPSDGAYRRVE
jgi:hypothetical protein